MAPAMIAYFLAVALQGAPPPPPPPLIHTYDELLIYFGPGPMDMREWSRPAIDEAVKQIRLYEPRKILIIGHTDSLGPADLNMQLSAQRAELVRQALIKAGAPADRIELTARGETQPAVHRADEVAEPLNNRVIVVLRDLAAPPR
ncbi:hypothetical protein DDF67_07415 [Caulobacter endophyticus]|uniref:OmpA-like domain-containing protein n=2 Tax=Caulobacter endophyticus TaxID=2172652 RepID=A0A2T9K5T0_9CAUL|nr:hypothetical protein DDF67_07415 [Caulobacter endophyticus]